MEIDMSGFKVIYKDRIFNAVCFYDFEWDTGKPKNNSNIKKFKEITILALNEDGEIILITDESWRFQFVPILNGGDKN